MTISIPFFLIATIEDFDAAVIDNSNLGASPSELQNNPESDRLHALIDHQGSPEMIMQEMDNE